MALSAFLLEPDGAGDRSAWRGRTHFRQRRVEVARGGQSRLGPAWAAPDFDDSAWPTVKVPGSALPRQSGRWWLRFRVSVPAGEKITLGTAPLAEALEIYWNGVKVGTLGFPGFDLFPRSVMASAIVPADGRAVIALRIDRP